MKAVKILDEKIVIVQDISAAKPEEVSLIRSFFLLLIDEDEKLTIIIGIPSSPFQGENLCL